MKRMTKKVGYRYELNEGEMFTNTNAIGKLGCFEDIEESLGISLVRLFSAKEVWVKEKVVWCLGDNRKTEIKTLKTKIIGIDIQEKMLIVCDCTVEPDNYEDCDSLSLDLYGKSWAFTKEELKW